MTKETKVNRQAFDIPGKLSGPDGLEVDVRFDLMELEDLIDGFPGPKFSYGVLRFGETLAPALEGLLLSASRLILTAGGTQFTLILYRLTSFTVLNAIGTVNVTLAEDERVAA